MEIKVCRGFPLWLSGKEPTCQCRRQGFNRWFGKIPMLQSDWACAPQLRSLCSRTHMPQLLKPVRPVFCNRRSHHNEKSAHPYRGWPVLTTTRKPAQQQPSATKKEKKTKRGHDNSTISVISGPICNDFFFSYLWLIFFLLFAYLVTVDQMLTFTLLIGKFYFVFLTRLCSGIAVLKHLFKLCLDGLSFILSGCLALLLRYYTSETSSQPSHVFSSLYTCWWECRPVPALCEF